MVTIRPFMGIRPPQRIVKNVASRPYDVLDSEEARAEAGDNKKSLLHIIKPEIDFPVGTDLHSDPVYEKAKENFALFREKGWLKQDSKSCLYIYAQTMEDRTQYGLVAAASVEDYKSNRIKKHELTRKDKEEDRTRHTLTTNAHIEPVFFSYRAVPEIDQLIALYTQKKQTYDFTSTDGIRHQFWVIKDQKGIGRLVDLFADIPCSYVADGHHRSAAAYLTAERLRGQNPGHTGGEEYNFFLAVHFPDNQLKIFDYNRVVKDLNGLTTQQFIQKLEMFFFITEKKELKTYRPTLLHNFSMYLEGTWYSLTAKPGTYNDLDPIGVLDVTILSEYVLNRILGIKDLRTDKRIDFVGGIRGLQELEKRVDSGEMKVAFALYPVSMKQLLDIADSGNIMPPKTTWFEPKLRSGLVIHEF